MHVGPQSRSPKALKEIMANKQETMKMSPKKVCQSNLKLTEESVPD
jgi:hypothetical protein